MNYQICQLFFIGVICLSEEHIEWHFHEVELEEQLPNSDFQNIHEHVFEEPVLEFIHNAEILPLFEPKRSNKHSESSVQAINLIAMKVDMDENICTWIEKIFCVEEKTFQSFFFRLLRVGILRLGLEILYPP